MQASVKLCCPKMYLIMLDFSFIESFSNFSLLNVCSLFLIWVCARANPNLLTSDTVWWCQPPPQECPWNQEVLRGIKIWKISLVTTAQLRPCRLRILVWIFSELEELSPATRIISPGLYLNDPWCQQLRESVL